MRGEKLISSCNRNGLFLYFATTNLDYKILIKVWNSSEIIPVWVPLHFHSFSFLLLECTSELVSVSLNPCWVSAPCLVVILTPCAHSICWVADLWIKQGALEHLHIACHIYHHTCLVCIHSPLLKLQTLTRHNEPEGGTHHGLLLRNWPLLGCPYCKGWEEKVHG